MQKTNPLIRTKLHLPFIRSELVSRPRLQAQVTKGLHGPLTLIIAPAGFGKTTLAAVCVTGCGMPVAWLSLDKNDNQTGRFLSYLVAALQEADHTIGSESAQLVESLQPAPPELVLTSLIDDLDSAGTEIVLVLDDYQVVSSQVVHEAVSFLLEHCPRTFHLVIASRSDPPLQVARLRGRGQAVELRAADLSFTEAEAAQFLNEVMGLHLDTGSIAVLEERTEGWIAGLQMAALSMRDREDVLGFIEGFSGTNRYIMDYLLGEILASQPPKIQRFLLYTSILERLTAPLCDALLKDKVGKENRGGTMKDETGEPSFIHEPSSVILDYLERANLFLVPLDDERTWYRYHHLFADLLRTQLHKSIDAQGVTQLHLYASAWHEQNDSILDAIHHASLAPNDELVERLIEQNYLELVKRGEMSSLRFWTGKLSKELVYSRPQLCIYEAMSRAWFGDLDEADGLLEVAEKRIRSEIAAPDAYSMLAHLTYVKSRVTAMRGDLPGAIEMNLAAREYLPAGNLALQMDIEITLGYLYYLVGDYLHASQVMNETIRSGKAVGAVINTVGGYYIMARLYAIQGLLNKSYELYGQAAQWIHETGGKHLGASSVIEVGMADVLCEWNDLDAALVRMKQGLALIHSWGKADDLALAYTTLARIQLALGNRAEATGAIEKAALLVQTRGVFSEARNVVEAAQVRMWLVKGDWSSVGRWAVTLEKRFSPPGLFRFEDELVHIMWARVSIAQNKPDEAIRLLSDLEESARSGGRQGRLIEIMILKALALQAAGELSQADLALTNSLALAEPNGYIRVFLDEGLPMQMLLVLWHAHATSGPLRDYATRLLSNFNAEPQGVTAVHKKASPTVDLVEPLSERELEVLHLIAIGRTNKEIAQQLIVSLGTVKAHTAGIFRKLDVANRTEAVARARQLGILP